MPRGVRNPKNESASPLRYCRICGHLLAEQNNTGQCFRHRPADSPVQSHEVVFIPPPSPIASDRIIKAVCQLFNLTIDDLQLKDKVETRRIARKVSMFLLIHDGNMGVKDAGQIVGRNYHAARFAEQEISTEIHRRSDVVQKVIEIRALYLARQV